MTAPYTLADLKTAYQRKEKLKYLYFWGHTPKHKNEIDKAVFSNGILRPSKSTASAMRLPNTI